MSQPPDSTSPDYVQNALEAACDALMTLELIGGSEQTLAPSTELNVAQAIASLRHAISELRLAHDHDSSGVALGFVLQTASERPANQPGASRQARPRRTA